MVGFGLKKLLRSQSASDKPEDAPESDETKSRPRKQFSLDFPPGLVHSEAECEDSPKKWSALKKIISDKKPR